MVGVPSVFHPQAQDLGLLPTVCFLQSPMVVYYLRQYFQHCAHFARVDRCGMVWKQAPSNTCQPPPPISFCSVKKIPISFSVFHFIFQRVWV